MVRDNKPSVAMERDVRGLDLVREGSEEGSARQALQGTEALNGAQGQRCPGKLAEESLLLLLRLNPDPSSPPSRN